MGRSVTALLLMLAVAAALAVGACVSPSTPLSPVSPDGTASFTGHIVTTTGSTIVGARLTVLTGANKDAQTTTDGAGRYAFAGLQADTFNVLIEASGFTSITPKVDLFMDVDANFALAAVP